MIAQAAPGATVPAAWVDELCELIRIPSVSTDPAHAGDLRRAAEWVAGFVERLGGEATLTQAGAGPIVHATIAASPEVAPPRPATVLLYGHYDVQPPGDPADWESPPFEPEVRDGWLYGRGATDDKGNLYALVKAVELLKAERRLPVDVVVLCDGEEEVLGTTICDHLAAARIAADACLIFDAPMVTRDLPALITGSRGMLYLHVAVAGNATPLHSGLYGGAALNAAHVLMALLQAVIARAGELTVGAVAPSASERDAWALLEPGEQMLAGSGALPADDHAAAEFHARTLAAPAVDVTSLGCADPRRQANAIPSEAEAHLSVRLAPGQDAADVLRRVVSIIDDAAPAGVRVSVEPWSAIDGAVVATDSPVIGRAREAFQRVLGVTPPTVRTGGSLPILGALARQGIPTVLTGFAPPEARVHSANERFLLSHLASGVAVAAELLGALGDPDGSTAQPRMS